RRVKASLADLTARWCRTSTGQVGPRHGSGSYQIPAAMRRIVQRRDVTCRFPGCRRQASHADIDHTVPYHHGEATCPCNLAILCRRHHRLKQRPEWTLVHLSPGVLLWISPTGHWYLVAPPRRRR
ncbi:MAG TPA: HNH endonuclease signature motif containing protein, partial [Actinomycetota bacterium]|nr:HNH endonuclease signature motif containing protein [Actinomycetota bacterium]